MFRAAPQIRSARTFLAKTLQSCGLAIFPAILIGILCVGILGGADAKPDASEEAREIVAKSLQRDWTDFSTQRDYTYQQRTEFLDYDNKGKVQHTRSETAEIIIVGGRRYERNIAKDDKALSPGDDRHEQEKLDREAARRAQESPSDRAKFLKERAAERAYLGEIPEAFVFQLKRTENLDGIPAWVISAEPKPGYRPVDSKAARFSKLRATIWIEQATYHWIKVEADVFDTMSFGLGMFRVAPGTKFEFEQKFVNNEIWLPSQMRLVGDARLALVKKIHGEMDVRYSDYKKFTSDSKILDAQTIEEAPKSGARSITQ